jgi:hypothetical protein
MPKGRHRGKRNGSTKVVQGSLRKLVSSALSRAPNNIDTVVTRKMNFTSGLNSNGSGIINYIVNLTPTSFTDWSSLAPTYDEFRIIGAEISVLPSIISSTTPQVNQFAVMVYDNDDATSALTSVVQGMDYKVKCLFPIFDISGRMCKLRITVWSTGSAESGVAWQTTAIATVARSFKFYCANLANSTSYGQLVCSIIIQLRGPT